MFIKIPSFWKGLQALLWSSFCRQLLREQFLQQNKSCKKKFEFSFFQKCTAAGKFSAMQSVVSTSGCSSSKKKCKCMCYCDSPQSGAAFLCDRSCCYFFSFLLSLHLCLVDQNWASRGTISLQKSLEQLHVKVFCLFFREWK